MTRIRIAAVLFACMLAPSTVCAQQQVEPGRTIIRLNDGGPTQPTKTYQNDPLLGTYRIGASNEGFTAGGVLRWDYNTTRLNFSNGYQLTSNSNVLIGSVADKLNAAHLAIASQAIGDLLYASSSTAFTRLADVATGSVLVSGGTGTAPAWSANPTLASLVATSSIQAPVFTTGGDITLNLTVNAATRWFIGSSGSTYEFGPNADNSYDIGGTATRARSGYFGTALVVGTNPASAGSSADIRLKSGFLLQARNNGNTADGTILATDAQDKALLAGVPISMTDSTVQSLGATVNGLLFVTNVENAQTAIFHMNGIAHVNSWVAGTIVGAGFSVTAGTTSSINIYWSAANSRYEIENKRGGTRTFLITLLGTN